MVKGSKRALWNASAAVALVLPAAAFSFAHGSATGARRVAAPAAAPAMMVTGMSAPLQVTRPGLAIIGPAAAAPVPDQLALHAAITAAWRQHLQAVIAADRARAAARRAAARRAAARAAAHAAARAAARAVAARRARAGLTARVRAAAAAVPAAAGSWQQIVASLAGQGAGCLDNIIEHESGGSVHATNPNSGAYGIPQALPAAKMASAGPDWQTNPVTQVRWMVQYVDTAYGGACGAWTHWQADGSY